MTGKCSVVKNLEIVPGDKKDYDRLAHYHYRDSHLGPYAAIFAIRPGGALRFSPVRNIPLETVLLTGNRISNGVSIGTKTIGVIVYTMPAPGLELRNIALGNMFGGLDRTTQLSLVNKTIRCISRVIIEPRFRGLGLAVRLVSETMPLMNVPVIEAMAVMGEVNPFFEKTGLTAYTAPLPVRCAALAEAFSMVGIAEQMLIDPQQVQNHTETLEKPQRQFIEGQIRIFLQSYGRRRNMPAGIERTRYVLGRLTTRPVYYVWFSPLDNTFNFTLLDNPFFFRSCPKLSNI